MVCYTKDIGSLGEDTAAKYLEGIGYRVIERNYRTRCGEIDIIGKDGEYISFIEVKTRYGTFYGSPSESVTYPKQLKLYKSAQLYIMQKKLLNANFRFDVIEIIFSHNNGKASIRLLKNAFQL